MVAFLFDGPETAPATLLLAHGAGAAMDSAAMTAASKALARAGFRVARFEFGYMAARRTTEARKPPPKAELLMDEYRAAIRALAAPGRLIIGGKSMGGRVASLIADEEREAPAHFRFFSSRRLLSTERNASCGISTPPTCRIRFLPSFCFSRSFRLRVTSPP